MRNHFEKVVIRHKCGHEQTHTLAIKDASKGLLLALTERNCAECSKKNEIDLTKKAEAPRR